MPAYGHDGSMGFMRAIIVMGRGGDGTLYGTIRQLMLLTDNELAQAGECYRDCIAEREWDTGTLESYGIPDSFGTARTTIQEVLDEPATVNFDAAMVHYELLMLLLDSVVGILPKDSQPGPGVRQALRCFYERYAGHPQAVPS